ncbi:MAG: glycine cleavage system aminomethyltransferase GcvT [Spirochaetaceae bacterium]|nr:glycine cleavage system aminomethyltransferase GcvT [Spirochaetaceae bacterium]
MLKHTPLYEKHKTLGAKIVDFGGWEMPIQYTSIIEEHTATREKAGLFDVSHMGEIIVKGKEAKNILNTLITNDMNLLHPKKIIYSPVPNEKGGVVDDLLVYMISDEEFLLVVNASNTEKDFSWFKEKISIISSSLEIINSSTDYGQIAIQGPSAQVILQKLTNFNLDQINFFTFDYVEVCGKKIIVSRTGYTGEDGFEIYCHHSQTEEIWDNLLSAGKNEGILPVGLGARDTLRLEAALPLYGHEFDDNITPIEAGLKFFVKPNKGNFIGADVLKKQIEEGTAKKLTGIELIDKGVPRSGYKIEKDGVEIGYVTSGTYSPTLKKGVAMVMISAEMVQPRNEVDVIIRDNKIKAKIVKLPFYQKKTKK